MLAKTYGGDEREKSGLAWYGPAQVVAAMPVRNYRQAEYALRFDFLYRVAESCDADTDASVHTAHKCLWYGNG